MVGLVFSSCAEQRQQTLETQRKTRTVTITRAQTLAPDGVTLVELTTRTTTITDELTGQTLEEVTVQEQPKILGTIGAVVKTVATATMGPAAGQVVQTGLGLLESILGGAGIAAAAGGTGAVMLKRKQQEAQAERERAETAERHRQQLIDGVESAKRHMPEDVWRNVRSTLRDNQDDDLIKVVADKTA
jgi:hypothetical protein